MCYHLAMWASDNFILMNSHIYYVMYFFLSLSFLSLLSLSLMALLPLLIYNAITFFFFSFMSIVYFLILPHYQQKTNSQSAIWFIYSFIITIYKSNLHLTFSIQTLSHLSAKEIIKKNFETNRDSQVPNTITYSSSIHNHPQNTHTHTTTTITTTQSQIHKHYKIWSMECG